MSGIAIQALLCDMDILVVDIAITIMMIYRSVPPEFNPQ